MKRELFLVGSSLYGNGKHLAHCHQGLKEFLGSMEQDDVIAYIPYATEDWLTYSRKAEDTFSQLGYTAKSVVDFLHPSLLLNDPKTKAVFVEGGDTFLLCKMLKSFNLENLISRDIKNGSKKYIGSGAGVVIVCPVIPSLPMGAKALNVIDLQISPYCVPGGLVYKTEEKIPKEENVFLREYHRRYNNSVVGLPDGSWIEVKNGDMVLSGLEWAEVHRKEKGGTFWLPGEPYPVTGML